MCWRLSGLAGPGQGELLGEECLEVLLAEGEHQSGPEDNVNVKNDDSDDDHNVDHNGQHQGGPEAVQEQGVGGLVAADPALSLTQLSHRVKQVSVRAPGDDDKVYNDDSDDDHT